MKKKSLNILAWNKLRSDRFSFFSLYYIGFVFLIAIFAPLISPDKTIDANQMSLQIAAQKPGTKIMFLETSIENNESVDESLIDKFFLGRQLTDSRIPVDSLIRNSDNIIYFPYQTGLAKYYTGDYQIIHQTFWLGTDKYGRDLLSRILYGARVSLSVGLISVFISVIIGISFGLIAGYFRGRTDDIIMWFVNVIWSIPTLLMVIAITLALGKGFWQVFVAVGLTMWVEVARIVRGQVLVIRELEYIEAGKALGYTSFRILFKHILPNIIGPVIVISAANFASAILIEAGLSFLGIGTQPPMPSWGGMIKDHYSYIIMDKSYLAIIPGIAIMSLVLAFMILGNGLRDAFDVKN